MANRTYSRRDFLCNLALSAGGVALLGGCNGERPATPTDEDLVEQPPPVGDPLDTPPVPPEADTLQVATDVSAAECPGYADLTEEQRSVRSGLQYSDASPEPGEFCGNCDFVVQNEQFNPCSGCTILAGPVAPRGWCSAWVAAGA